METLRSPQVESPPDEGIKEALRQIHEQSPEVFARFEMGWRKRGVRFPSQDIEILQKHGLVDEHGAIRPQVREFLNQMLGEGIVD